MAFSRNFSHSNRDKSGHVNLEDANTCRILVVGNPGVGKTSFVHLLAHGKVLVNPKWTCGCNIEVVPHITDYDEYVMELWDVGASPKFKKSRRIFYRPLPSSISTSIDSSKFNSSSPSSQVSDVNGLILVHDLSNSKSYANLSGWLREVMREISSGKEIVWDQEISFNGGANSLPVILVGTKSDLIGNSSTYAADLAELGVDTIEISTLQVDTFSPNSVALAKLSIFFDKCISNKQTMQSITHMETPSSQQMNNNDFPGSPNLLHSPSMQHPSHDPNPSSPWNGKLTNKIHAYPSSPPMSSSSAQMSSPTARNQKNRSSFSTISSSSMDPMSSSYADVGGLSRYQWETNQEENNSIHDDARYSVPHSRHSKAAYSNILDAPENDEAHG